MRLTLKELELLNTASAYNGEQHKAICGKAALELTEYKRIEEELGIDLITLFKALKNGCFAKETFDYMGKEQTQIIFTEFTYFYYADDIGAYFIHIRTKNHYLKDYGKTWALTKEELENDNHN